MKCKAFTLFELLIIIGILAILSALLVPPFIRTRELAHKAACMSNLREIYVAINLFSEDHADNDEILTPSSTYEYANKQVWYCQNNPLDEAQSYFLQYPLSANVFSTLSAEQPELPLYVDPFHHQYGYWLVLNAGGKIYQDINPCRVIGRAPPYDHLCE